MDRHDIDALLVGALYGELTPADEARLTAHLESHPADRGALDDLKSARAKVRESRIFDLQAEPPQHISALLLQEAHRRAPKKVVADDGEKRDSWFWRFARSFALHPAMAAAAMLVVVLGVSAIALKNKGSSSMREAQPSATSQSDNAEMTPTEAPAVAVNGDTMAAGSAAPMNEEGASYHAGLAEKDDLTADPSLAQDRKKADESAAQRWRSDTDGKVNKNQGIAVTTEQMQPKDLEEDRDERRNALAESKLAKEKSAEQQKKAANDRAGALNLDGADDGYGYAPTTGAAPGRGVAAGTGGGGASGGLVAGGAPQGNTVTKGNAGPAAAAPSPAPSTAPSATAPANRPSYAQPPPPPPSTDKATTTATVAPKTEAAKPSAPAKQEAKADAKPTTPSTPTTTTGAKTGSSTTSDANKKTSTQKPAEEKPAEKTVQKSPPKAVSKQPAPAQQAPAAPPADPTIAWAKQQHQRAVALTKNGDCKGAAQVALGVSQKAPAYYASYMASDRDLKSCKSYIDDARDREAEKSAKSRAQKRVNADEPAAPAESVK
jgi:hypothetical protein